MLLLVAACLRGVFTVLWIHSMCHGWVFSVPACCSAGTAVSMKQLAAPAHITCVRSACWFFETHNHLLHSAQRAEQCWALPATRRFECMTASLLAGNVKL